MGFSYDSIESLSEHEIQNILGVEQAMIEYENENAKMHSDLQRSQIRS